MRAFCYSILLLYCILTLHSIALLVHAYAYRTVVHKIIHTCMHTHTYTYTYTPPLPSLPYTPNLPVCAQNISLASCMELDQQIQDLLFYQRTRKKVHTGTYRGVYRGTYRGLDCMCSKTVTLYLYIYTPTHT